MQTALLLVDLQADFINRPGLCPIYADIETAILAMLAHARSSGMTVAHVRTRVAADGSDCMPHWRANDIWQCVAGTPGLAPPSGCAELAGERVFYKQFFSGFDDAQLEPFLRERSIEKLWIAGLYTHACIRETALDAYRRGFLITVVEDAIASTEPLHAEISRSYLAGRAATFSPSSELLSAPRPVASHFQPADSGILVAEQQTSTNTEIDALLALTANAQHGWRALPHSQRQQMLGSFAGRLQAAFPRLEAMMISELGKPLKHAREELQRALAHVEEARHLANEKALDPATLVVYQSLGTVAMVTPWNNPVAIAMGKLTAALVLGNTVVWKPAPQAVNISRCLLQLLRDSGVPTDVLQMAHGGPAQVRRLAASPAVAAVSLTGSEQSGRAIAAICAAHGKALQAELGGNNALLVLADADLPAVAKIFARLAFGFAGQRCTAIRRFVVECAVAAEFEQLLATAIDDLPLFEPQTDTCEIGPMISAAQLQRVEDTVASALQRGARLVRGGSRRQATPPGHYFEATLLADLPADDPLVQRETFGPVALIQQAGDFAEGIELVNAVPQGLVAGIATRSAERYEAFATCVQAGILIDSAGLRIHPAAPFSGRKASQIGPPEHGDWDRQFFSLAQSRYRGVSL